MYLICHMYGVYVAKDNHWVISLVEQIGATIT